MKLHSPPVAVRQVIGCCMHFPVRILQHFTLDIFHSSLMTGCLRRVIARHAHTYDGCRCSEEARKLGISKDMVFSVHSKPDHTVPKPPGHR